MSTVQKSELELRKIRESIYAREVLHSVTLSKQQALKSLLRGVKGEVFHVPAKSLREGNFTLFVENNFTTDFDESPWPDMKDNLKAYVNLKNYALEDYGAAMIYRVLEDNKRKTKQERFQVRYDDGSGGEFAKAGFNFIMVSKNFPDNKRFPGGEIKFTNAIIHHEFGHTRFYTTRKGPIVFQLEDERKAVLENSNPVRIFHGIEPRYTYTNREGITINIINGTKCTGHCTIKEDDPRVLVQKGSIGALKW
jgi:hypothetical protein